MLFGQADAFSFDFTTIVAAVKAFVPTSFNVSQQLSTIETFYQQKEAAMTFQIQEILTQLDVANNTIARAAVEHTKHVQRLWLYIAILTVALCACLACLAIAVAATKQLKHLEVNKAQAKRKARVRATAEKCNKSIPELMPTTSQMLIDYFKYASDPYSYSGC
ncbi:hypothetical protein EV183_000489 [Coemansia sp. RSA 2336]|nr:hypothetical protein EV183_000489 [Coemansia sp. RSA 2336]